jgi:cell division protein FtsQ
VRACVSLAWRHRRVRRTLLAVLAALPLLAGGWLWLRDSSLVAVQRVEVSGVHGAEAHALTAALVAAAQHMSTLDVNSGALRSAAAPFAVVREVRAVASFPHRLLIQVVEQLPVAALSTGGVRTAVAADGVVLGPSLLSGSIPSVSGEPGAAGIAPPTGQRVHGAPVLAELTVLGAAPVPLERVVAHVSMGPKGLIMTMRNGLLAYFGDATRPHAKWLSLARVLADPGSAGASYVDVRVPERPAAGFAAGTTAPEMSAAGAEAMSASDPTTAAALAAELTSAVGGGSPASPIGHEAPAGAQPEASSGAQAASGAAAGTTSAPGETTPTGVRPTGAGAAGTTPAAPEGAPAPTEATQATGGGTGAGAATAGG